MMTNKKFNIKLCLTRIFSPKQGSNLCIPSATDYEILYDLDNVFSFQIDVEMKNIL